jgi:hypothetical protein
MDGITREFEPTAGEDLVGTIVGNRVFGNANVGITAVVDTVVRGNDIYANATGIQGMDVSIPRLIPFTGSILNNLVYANSSAGIQIEGADGAQLRNNTVYQLRGDGIRVTAAVTLRGVGSQNVQLRNNILWTASGYDINVANDSQQGFDSNYNLLCTTGTGSIGYWQSAFADLRDWQFETGIDAQSITGNPEFISPAGPDGILGVDPTTGVDGGQDDNFHLQNGSPAVAAGDPSSDYSLQPAPSGGRINPGAYGNTPQATTTAATGVIVLQPSGSMEVAVGGAASSYSVALTSQPASDVTVTLATDNPLTLSTSTLTFTPSDWSSPQTVSVKQVAQPNISGDYTVTISQTAASADSNYNGISIPSVIVHVDQLGTTVIPGRAAPTVTWTKPASITAGTPLSALQLDAVASVPGTFVYSPPIGTVLGVGNDQALSVTFFPNHAADYEQVTSSTTIDVLPSTTLGQATLSLSGLNVTYNGLPHDATVATNPPGLAGVTVTYTKGGVNVAEPTQAGTYQVTATLSNPNYQATPVTGTFQINQVKPIVTWSAPAAITAGTALGSAQLDGMASVPGAFTYSPGLGTVLGIGYHQTLSATFVPTDGVDYQQVSTTTTIDVLPNLVTTAVIQFTSAGFAADITNGVASVVLTRTGNLASAVSVILSSPGGKDVAAFQQTVTVGAGVTSSTVLIPLLNDGRPSESNVAIPLTLSSPGAGSAVGATGSATLVIHDDNPPLVIVASLRVATVKVGTGKKAKNTTGLVLQFSGTLNPVQAMSLGDYHLVSGKTRKGHTTYSKTLALRSATYSPAAHTVTLIPKNKLSAAQPDELIVTGSVLTDTLGQPIDGNHDGQPGGNFEAIFKGKSLTIAATDSPNAIPASRLPIEAVDGILATAKGHWACPLRSAQSGTKLLAATTYSHPLVIRLALKAT